jgi:hypothetical protein
MVADRDLERLAARFRGDIVTAFDGGRRVGRRTVAFGGGAEVHLHLGLEGLLFFLGKLTVAGTDCSKAPEGLRPGLARATTLAAETLAEILREAIPGACGL